MNMINLEIRESVNQRCEMLKDNQRRMINSILEKPFKKVAIDRILINEAKGKEFFNDPDEVLEKIFYRLKILLHCQQDLLLLEILDGNLVHIGECHILSGHRPDK